MANENQVDANQLIDGAAGGMDLKAEIPAGVIGKALGFVAYAFTPATGGQRVIDRTDGYRQHRIAQVHGRMGGDFGVFLDLGSVVLLEPTAPHVEVVNGQKITSRVAVPGSDLYPGCTLISFGTSEHKRGYFRAEDQVGKDALLRWRGELASAGLEWFQKTGQRLSNPDAMKNVGLSGVAPVSRASVGAL